MSTTLRGIASHLGRGSDNTVIARGNGAAHIVNQIASFRIDGKPVQFKSRTLVSISDGDEVIAAGPMKNGTLEALAVRNISTGAVYGHDLVFPAILTVALALLGLMSLSMGIGYIILAIAAWVAWRLWIVRTAAQAVKGAV